MHTVCVAMLYNMVPLARTKHLHCEFLCSNLLPPSLWSVGSVGKWPRTRGIWALYGMWKVLITVLP